PARQWNDDPVPNCEHDRQSQRGNPPDHNGPSIGSDQPGNPRFRFPSTVRCRTVTRNILAAVVVIGLAGSLGFAQSSFDTSPETQGGEKPLGSYFATDIDTVSMSNGTLRLSIPLINLPGRELPLRPAMDY